MSNTGSLANVVVTGQTLGQTLAQMRSPGAQAVAQVMAAPVRPSASAVDAAQPIREAIIQAQQTIEKFVSDMAIELNFVRDETSGYIVVSVIDPQTGELIRRLPGDELLRLAQTVEQMGNMLVNQKA